jgi:KaiC/GvpD/RAD55 family RecA-like ATPase
MPKKGQSVTSTRLAYEGLPEELAEFLQRDTYSLLIKGESGTGKTILALTILRSLGSIENLLYLSTRTSPLQLIENYPWTEQVFGPATVRGEVGSSEAEGWETLVDARLDEPNVVFERITNVLMDKQAPTAVIDSWESLSDAMGSEALRTNIKVLQTWRERAGARFIFVGEDPTNSAIDFMVEGVVVLKDRLSDGRRLRQITLSKLHGVQIARPSYFFTLEGGAFRSFPTFSPRDYTFRNPVPVSFDKPFRRAKGRYPTGYETLDNHLDGGYPAKSLALVELEQGLDNRVGLIFVSRMVQDWLSAGDRVVLQRPRDVETRFINQFAKSFGGGKGQLRIVGPEPQDSEAIGGGKGGSRRPGGRTLAIWTDPEEGLISPTPAKGKLGPDMTIVLGRPSPGSASFTKEASTHLRFIVIEGTLFAECLLPWSSLYGVIPGTTGGNPMMTLEPVV